MLHGQCSLQLQNQHPKHTKTAQAALPALIGHKIMSTLKRKNDINKSSSSGEPHSKKAVSSSM